MLKKLREKCAFTLVELIVVLVILAILAALLVPALTGYIDKAKKEQTIADTRMLLTAVQTESSELYGKDGWKTLQNSLSTIASKDGSVISSLDMTPASMSETLKSRYQEIISLAGIASLQKGDGYFCCVINPSGKIHCIIYNPLNGHIGLYFEENQEYMAINASEAPGIDAYSAYFNKVTVTVINPSMPDSWSKNILLNTIGYTDSWQ